jgi:hypothetical protein
MLSGVNQTQRDKSSWPHSAVDEWQEKNETVVTRDGGGDKEIYKIAIR